MILTLANVELGLHAGLKWIDTIAAQDEWAYRDTLPDEMSRRSFDVMFDLKRFCPAEVRIICLLFLFTIFGMVLVVHFILFF